MSAESEAAAGIEARAMDARSRRRMPDVNPVLRRELLERWRGRRAVLVLTLYVAAVGVLLVLLRWLGLTILENRARWGGLAGATAGPLLGRFLVENLLALVLGLVLLVTPGYAAAQLSGERERRTLGLLRITLVRPRSIVLGKLGASSAWIVLLVLVTAPLAATAMVLGGVVLSDLLAGITVIVVSAVTMAAIGLAVSSRARRTTSAVVATYAVVALLVGGTVAAAVVQYAMSDFRRIDTPAALYLNPFVALADATHARPQTEMPSILSPLAMVLGPEVWGGFAVVDDIGVDAPMPAPAVDFGDGMVIERGFVELPARRFPVAEPIGPNVPRRQPVWLISLGLYLAIAAGAVVLAASSIGPREGIRET